MTPNGPWRYGPNLAQGRHDDARGQDLVHGALIAKTAEPHPTLEGTVYTAAAQIEAAGGRALPVVGDIRDEAQVERAVAQAVERFGGIDVCVNKRLGDQPVRHRGAGDQALRPDAVDQHPRHVRGQPGLHLAPEAIGEPAHPDPVPAGQPGAALARTARRLQRA